jgi:cell division protein FtsZ
MTINLSLPSAAADPAELRPRITVIGIGGAGGNAVNNMIRLELQGVDFIVANTDAQALRHSRAEKRIQLGVGVTQGLGAGARPDLGRAAAEEALPAIVEQIKGTHMAFIAAGLGGGTGTGAAPIIAKACREHGVLTIGVVTKPFQFEGPNRMRLADAGLQELEGHVDTLIVIPNQNLFRIANEKTTFADAFAIADDVLYSGVRSVTDLMVMPGLINLDFADVRSVMSEMGKAMMGTGESEGERRALDAAEAAIANPLIDDASMKGARGVLINITGGRDMTLFEVDEAANRIRAEVDEDAHIIFGAAYDESLEGRVRVSVVATGIRSAAAHMPKPAEAKPSLLERLQAIRPASMTAIAAAKPEARIEPVMAAPTVAKTIPAVTAAAIPAEPVPAAPSSAAEAKAETIMAAEAAELVAPQECESVEALAQAVLHAADVSAAATESSREGAPNGATRPTHTASESSPAVAASTPIETASAAPAASDPRIEGPGGSRQNISAPTPAISPAPRRPLVRDLPRPAAMPKMGALDAFIPSAPAAASESSRPINSASESSRPGISVPPAATTPAATAPTAPARESHREAAKATPISAAARRAFPSLFDRITSRQAQAQTSTQSKEPAAKPAAAAAPGLAVQSGGLAAPAGSSLKAEPTDRLGPSGPEDDLLDIPAFLRRQAN